MIFKSKFSTSYKGIKSNKVRSILTSLGIIIGVASVIILVSVTSSAKKMIEEQLTQLGGKSLMIRTGKLGVGVLKNTPVLTVGDAKAIKDLKYVLYVSPIVDTSKNVVWNKKSWFTVILGVSVDFVFINDWYPDIGNFFSSSDTKNSERLCVLGSSVATNVFGSRNPIGETIRLGDNSFKVIGVMNPMGQTPSGKDQDDIVLIPYSTYQRYISGVNTLEAISVSISNSADLKLVKSQILEVLRTRHGVSKEEENTFNISTQSAVLNRISTISQIMKILLSGIASISLIVGGIGIMNIMLVSVTERTREIGIRMAVGAKERDILLQFLFESVLLSVIGGLIGIVIGIFGSILASQISTWPLVISIVSILIAFSFAGIIGIFFGVYPARKASKLNPIEALRN